MTVFLVAILLVNFKMDSSIIIMKVKIGTTFIAISVILRMLSSSMINNEKNVSGIPPFLILLPPDLAIRF